MIFALIDNGSLEPAATRNLRAVAAALSTNTGLAVQPVSWKHSDRLPAADLDGTNAITLAPFIRAHVARGEAHFLFVPFFISAQGAIGSALRNDLEKLRASAGPFEFTFAEGLAARGAIAAIVAERIRETITARRLRQPAVIVVDHGGPSPTSAALRDQLAADVRALVGSEVATLLAASMEGEEHAHNHPVLADALASLSQSPAAASTATAPDPNRPTDVVIAPLFLSPGRHAGPNGDLAQIAGAVEAEHSTLHCHFTELVGTHPRAAEVLTEALLAATHTPASLS